MKTWKLDSQQRVSADLHRNVYFKHYSGKTRGITLSWRQFLNLNDILLDLEIFKKMKYYPLGNHIWLQYYKNHIQLYHCHLNIYFTFHESSWYEYLKAIHRKILSFLRHGATTLHGRKHAPTHENLFQSRSCNAPSTSSKHKVISGEATNATGENEQCQKSPNLSEWDSANSGRPFSFIGAVNAIGTTTNAMSDMEEGEVLDITSDGGQLSDFFTIE